MSADNWAVCPKCKANKLAARDEAKRLADESYGRVDSSEYLRLLQVSSIPVTEQETMREDYEIGIDDEGLLIVSFQASCECGFEFTFKHQKNVLNAKAQP